MKSLSHFNIKNFPIKGKYADFGKFLLYFFRNFLRILNIPYRFIAGLGRFCVGIFNSFARYALCQGFVHFSNELKHIVRKLKAEAGPEYIEK